MKRHFYFYILLLFATYSCTKTPPANEILDGPVEGLSGEQSQRFLRGDAAFNDHIFTTQTGLGPLFVATSCGSCHPGDGKGHAFSSLTRFGQTDSTGNQYLASGGPQLQHRAIPGYQPEQIPAGVPFTTILPPANTGLGFIELVSDADLIAMSDPDDANGDGISGVPNWHRLPPYAQPHANAVSKNGKYICRFGKKAGVYSLLQQTANAYNQDMGITSVYEPHDTYTHQAVEPEISESNIADVVFYLQTLKAPVPRDENHPDVLAGKQIFKAIGCESCHRETLRTTFSSIAPLSNKEFHPYTDLLLHDMGEGLNDGYTEGSALPSEWRTPALWGLGLSLKSQGGQYFLLHDGRAHSIQEAITLHGGEGNKSREQFQQLSEPDQQKFIRFLESL